MVLGISVSSHDISDRNIPQSVQKLYRRSNEVMSDFKSLSCNVKSQLFSTFCLDAYGSQLWPFFNNSVKLYYTAWRKVIRKAWCLPFTTHCRFLHTINNSLPIDVQLEKRCLKFLHSCLNSSNEVVKSISLSSIQQSFSTFGENYRYLCHKYKIMPYMFRSDFPIIIKQIHLYVDDHHGPPPWGSDGTWALYCYWWESLYCFYSWRDVSFGRIFMHYINKCNCICTWCSMTVCMCITNDYSKIYVYGIPLFSILIWFIDVYIRIENVLYYTWFIFNCIV